MVETRSGSSLYSTRPARLITKAKSGPGSTPPARELKMPWLNWLDTSLFELKIGRFFESIEKTSITDDFQLTLTW